VSRQTIFITGAASGIGKATALQFHERGWFVGAVDVDESGLTALSAELGGDCFTAYLDVRDKAAFDRVMTAFARAAGDRLDILFNNAGIAIFGTLNDLPFEKVVDTVNVNLLGVLNGMHAAMPLLAKTENALCFSTASSAASFGAPGLATYGATKAAVKSLTEAMSVELARVGARAADVSPGIIDTPLWEATRYVKGERTAARNLARLNEGRDDAARTLPAEEVAASVWKAYNGNRLHWYVPEEVADREKAKVENPEKLRDELIARHNP
jgi:NADP-dependent 3-hydroxy acid dehydrogenase YdfG